MKLSIVIPVYNTEKYLPACLDSVGAQTLRDFELICVDDGSTDSTPAILREYASKDSRIKIISKPNSGYGNSVNVGIRAARGTFLAILEPDDYIAPTMYEKLCDAAEKNRVPVAKCTWDLFWEENGVETARVRWHVPHGLPGRKIFSPREHPEMIADAPGIWAAVYKRAWLLDNDIFCLETPGASFQDTAFGLKVFFSASSMTYVPEALHSYRQTNPNSSTNSVGKKAHFVFEEFEETKRWLEARGDWTAETRALLFKKKACAYACWLAEKVGPEFPEIHRRMRDDLKREYKFFSGTRPAVFSPEEWERRVSDMIREPPKNFFGKKLLVRLAAMFILNRAARKRFRARHLNLDPRFKK